MIWGRLILFSTFNNSIVILILCIRILQYYAVISVCVGFDVLYDFYPKTIKCIIFHALICVVFIWLKVHK